MFFYIFFYAVVGTAVVGTAVVGTAVVGTAVVGIAVVGPTHTPIIHKFPDVHIFPHEPQLLLSEEVSIVHPVTQFPQFRIQ